LQAEEQPAAEPAADPADPAAAAAAPGAYDPADAAPGAYDPADAAEPFAPPRNAYVIPADGLSAPADGPSAPAGGPSAALPIRSILPSADGMPPGAPNATAIEAQGIDPDLRRVSEEIERLRKSLAELSEKTQALL
jgi:hypothetical protein